MAAPSKHTPSGLIRNERIEWELRFRSPVSSSKGVDTVKIETETRDEKEATALAYHWLSTGPMSHPATRFIYVRPSIVATTADMRAAGIWPPPKPDGVEPEPQAEDETPTRNVAQSASRDETVPNAAIPPAAVPAAKPPSGRVGA